MFCSSAAFLPGYLNAGDSVSVQLEKGKRRFLGDRFIKYLAYFQQETTTAAPTDHLLEHFAMILKDKDCIGLIISTRPDSIAKDLLGPLSILLRHHGKECLFEIGLQTIHEKTLKKINRNHRYIDFQQAVVQLKGYSQFQVGAHLLFGLPGESMEDMLATLEVVIGLELDALKLHHLQVIRDTPLQGMYERGEFNTFSLAEYMEFLLQIIPMLPRNVVLHRLWSASHPELLIAPKWNILATELSRNLRDNMIKRELFQGKNYPSQQ